MGKALSALKREGGSDHRKQQATVFQTLSDDNKIKWKNSNDQFTLAEGAAAARRLSIYQQEPTNDDKQRDQYIADKKRVTAAIHAIEQNQRGNLNQIKSAIDQTNNSKNELIPNDTIQQEPMSLSIMSPISALSRGRSPASALLSDNNSFFNSSIPTVTIGKPQENEENYDEDKKLAALLKSLSSKDSKYEYVPNGLVTFSQFIEFVHSLKIFEFDENKHLKHIFRYLYTQDLPPNVSEIAEDDKYNNVNGMFLAYSECIGYEYEEIVIMLDERNGESLEEMLRRNVYAEIQRVYDLMKFDDQNMEEEEEDEKVQMDTYLSLNQMMMKSVDSMDFDNSLFSPAESSMYYGGNTLKSPDMNGAFFGSQSMAKSDNSLKGSLSYGWKG